MRRLEGPIAVYSAIRMRPRLWMAPPPGHFWQGRGFERKADAFAEDSNQLAASN